MRPNSSAPAEPAHAVDVLFALQLRIARRADELVRARADATELNLHCWLLAEAEVLSREGDALSSGSVATADPRET